MRIGVSLVLMASAVGAAGCSRLSGTERPLGTAPPRPIAYVAAPRRGERVCVEYRDDMYGRRYCSAYHPS